MTTVGKVHRMEICGSLNLVRLTYELILRLTCEHKLIVYRRFAVFFHQVLVH